MPGHFLSVALVGLALFQGAEPTSSDAPVTVDAAPAETAPAPSAGPAPLPNIDLPAYTFQGEPAPPQSVEEPQSESETQPAAEASAAVQKSEGEVPNEKPISEELIRPTEKKDRGSQKVGASWFITTGK